MANWIVFNVAVFLLGNKECAIYFSKIDNLAFLCTNICSVYWILANKIRHSSDFQCPPLAEEKPLIRLSAHPQVEINVSEAQITSLYNGARINSVSKTHLDLK